MNLHAVFAVVVKLFIGSGNYFMQKMMTSTCGQPGFDGPLPGAKKERENCEPGQSPFNKPQFIQFLVFASMAFSLVFFFFMRRKKIDFGMYGKEAWIIMLIPAGFEIVAFALGTYAQIMLAVSFAMIMKGAKVIFSGIFTATFLGRKLRPFHWFSIALCCAGLAIAGYSEFRSFNSSPKLLIGVFLSLGCECLKAFHVIFGEKLMKNRKFDPLFVVGVEGVYAVVLLLPALFLFWLAIPGDEDGTMENLPDTFHRIGESTLIQTILGIYPMTLLLVAVAGAMVTKHLSGVHNALVSVSRGIVVWTLELVVAHCAPERFAKMYGKKWEDHNYLKVIGFVCVIFATLMYDEDIKLRFLFNYDELTKEVSVTEEIKAESISGSVAEDETASNETRPAAQTGENQEYIIVKQN